MIQPLLFLGYDSPRVCAGYINPQLVLFPDGSTKEKPTRFGHEYETKMPIWSSAVSQKQGPHLAGYHEQGTICPLWLNTTSEPQPACAQPRKQAGGAEGFLEDHPWSLEEALQGFRVTAAQLITLLKASAAKQHHLPAWTSLAVPLLAAAIRDLIYPLVSIANLPFPEAQATVHPRSSTAPSTRWQ